MQKIYVIIPSYRPAEDGFLALTKQICDRGYTLIAVDDASPDATRPPCGAPDPRVILLRHERHRGRGAAIRTGLAYIQSTLLPRDLPPEAWVDGRLGPETAQIAIMASNTLFCIEDLDRLLAVSCLPENHARLAVGVHPPEKKRSFPRRIGNAMLHGLFHLLVRAQVPNDMTGLRVCSASYLPELLELEGDHADYELRQLNLFSKRGDGFCAVTVDGLQARKNGHILLDSARLYQRMLRFTCSSMFSFLVEYGLFCLLHYQLRHLLPLVGDLVATIVARLIGNGCNYVINCYFVFRRKPDRANLLQFAGLTGASIGLSALALYLWKLTGLPVPVCKILADLCVFVVNYIVQQKLIFRKRKNKQ